MLEVCLTEEELGRVGLCCHFALDYLCDDWNMVLAFVRKEEWTLRNVSCEAGRMSTQGLFFSLQSAG